MEELHLSEIRQLRNLFKDQGLNQIPDRMSVAESFFGTEEHLSVAQLVELLQGQEINLDEEFVEETLESLRRFGFAQKKEFADQPALYEHHHLDAHHDHLICVHCGRITEFFSPELERLQAEVAGQHGFKLLDHRHQLYGLCPKCRAERKPALPLALARPGESLEVVGYLGGRHSQNRLADMGLRPGVEVKVLTAEGGPIVVSCEGARLAVGKEMALKITCRPTENGPQD